MGKTTLSVVKPLRVCQYEKGYIEIMDGREPSEVFVHVFLYSSLNGQEVKRISDHYRNGMGGDFSITSEYIPEVDSICLSVKHPNLQLVKNTVLGKIELVSKSVLGI